jgi:hypothetical protein
MDAVLADGILKPSVRLSAPRNVRTKRTERKRKKMGETVVAFIYGFLVGFILTSLLTAGRG